MNNWSIDEKKPKKKEHMILKSQKGIWETDVKTINLSNPKVLKWYVERKIEVGDWRALDSSTLARMLGKLSIDTRLKELLQDFIKTAHGDYHTKSTAHTRRTRKK